MAEFETENLTHHGSTSSVDVIYSKSLDEATDFLEHYQIKGAKHGIRRFQNYDGTLTPAGRERYGIGPPREAKKDAEGGSGIKKATGSIKKKISDSRASKKAKKRENLKEYLRDHPKKLLKYKRIISEEEADEIINKINFDRKLQDIKYSEQDRKAARFNKFVGRVGDIKNLYKHGTEIYNQTAYIYNALVSSGKIGDKRFNEHRSDMLSKYGNEYMSKMTDDELKTFNDLKVKRDNKLLPVFAATGGKDK